MRYKYIILGAGCAGLSLAWYLLEEGVRDPILILDRKSCFQSDRTWCFWDTEPTPFTHLATHRWPAWTVRSRDGEAVHASTPAAPYVRLRGSDFYQAVLARIAGQDNVTLRLGVSLTENYRGDADGVVVSTSAGPFEGDYLFDALSLASPRFPVARAGDLTFLQRFFGQFIRADRDVFDPQTVTLMDFAAPPASERESGTAPVIRFMYLLPLSPREALVENTVLQIGGGAADTHAQPGNALGGRREIAAYLKMRHGLCTFQVTGEEQGAIPMTTRHFPVQTGSRTFSIGLAGGAARPSSGYAFLRIQQQCRALARMVAQGEGKAVPRTAAQTRTATLDAIFLRAMQQDPAAVPGYFERLFARVPSDALVRFLSGTASMRDCLALVRVLPLGKFAHAAVSDLPRWWTNGIGGAF